MLEHLLAPAYDTQNFTYCHDTAGSPIGRATQQTLTTSHGRTRMRFTYGGDGSDPRCQRSPLLACAAGRPCRPPALAASLATSQSSPPSTMPLLPPRRHRPHRVRWRQTGDLRTGGGHYTRPNAWPSAPPPRGAVSMMEGSALHQRRAIEALAGSHGRPYRGPPLGLQSGGGGAGRRLRLGTGPSQRLPRKQEGGGGRRKAMRHSGESRACSEG